MANGTPTASAKFFPAYKAPAAEHLEQGDLIAKTDAIQSIIKIVHPYYLKSDYTHFIVLTQSCDLVRRKREACKSRYITLAAVRPLSLVIQREIESYQDEFDKAGMVCSKKHRFELIQFLQRLHNFNEPEFFYLHSESNLDFPDPHCAFLRLSVSIKSSLHYDACLQARILSLNDVYQAKLGWRVGDMYSRVGTEDWVPGVESSDDFEKRISKLLDGACKWEDDKRLTHAKTNLPADVLQNGVEAVRKHISDMRMTNPLEEVIDAVISQLKKLSKIENDEDAVRIGNRLRNDPVMSRLRKLVG